MTAAKRAADVAVGLTIVVVGGLLAKYVADAMDRWHQQIRHYDRPCEREGVDDAILRRRP